MTNVYLNVDQLAKLRALEQELGGYSIYAHMPSGRMASLSEKQLKRLQAAEKELGVALIAYEVASPQPPSGRIAELSEKQLKRLQAAEEELGIVLVSWHPGK